MQLDTAISTIAVARRCTFPAAFEEGKANGYPIGGIQLTKLEPIRWVRIRFALLNDATGFAESSLPNRSVQTRLFHPNVRRFVVRISESAYPRT